MQIDIHQHIWTEPLLDALSARRRLPFVRRGDEQLTVLHSASERPYVIDVAAEAPAARARLLRADRADLAVIAISSPIGIEALPSGEARPLIAAHLDGVLELGDGFAAWGPLPIEDPDPVDVDELIARGCVGVSCLPARSPVRRRSTGSASCSSGSRIAGSHCSSIPAATAAPHAVEASLTEPCGGVPSPTTSPRCTRPG